MVRRIVAGALMLTVCASAQAAPVLFDWGFDIDGTQEFAPLTAPDFNPDYRPPNPGQLDVFNTETTHIDVSGFDFDSDPVVVDISFDPAFPELALQPTAPSGTGLVTITVTGAGAHHVGMYLDLEIDESGFTPDTSFFNETVSSSGTAEAGQSYEADEPGALFGDIFNNFVDQTLDNSIFDDDGIGEDFAMALAWDFSLAVGETATISFLVDSDKDSSLGGILLEQQDLRVDESYFFSSSLVIVPEPGTLGLLLLGLGGLALRRSRA